MSLHLVHKMMKFIPRTNEIFTLYNFEIELILIGRTIYIINLNKTEI